MTPKEALEAIRINLKSTYGFPLNLTNEYKILNKLTERDTPKATIKKIKVIYTQHKCPVCACRLEMIPLEEVNFCPKCGQRLDWK